MIGYTETEIHDRAEQAVRKIPSNARSAFSFGYLHSAVTADNYTPGQLKAVANGLNDGMEQE